MSAPKNAAKHTPAPWVRGGGFGPRSTAVTTTSGRHIAAVETWGVKHPDERAKYEDLHAWWPEDEANLNLIAASPDLLAEATLIARLETNEETLERTGDQQSGDDAVETLSSLIHRARALVAKAEGRE